MICTSSSVHWRVKTSHYRYQKTKQQAVQAEKSTPPISCIKIGSQVIVKTYTGSLAILLQEATVPVSAFADKVPTDHMTEQATTTFPSHFSLVLFLIASVHSLLLFGRSQLRNFGLICSP